MDTNTAASDDRAMSDPTEKELSARNKLRAELNGSAPRSRPLTVKDRVMASANDIALARAQGWTAEMLWGAFNTVYEQAGYERVNLGTFKKYVSELCPPKRGGYESVQTAKGLTSTHGGTAMALAPTQFGTVTLRNPRKNFTN